MRKRGFTLTELIIALAVIGIASALIIPAASKLVPDSNKLKVINTHTKLSNTITELLDNDACYYDPNAGKDGVTHCEGLDCTATSKTPCIAEASGDDKFKTLVFKSLLPDYDASSSNIKESDGTIWSIDKNGENYLVTIKVNGGSGNVYSPSNLRPGMFRFKVDKYGGVYPDDAMTAAYLKNSMKANSKEEDAKDAKDLYERYYKTTETK